MEENEIGLKLLEDEKILNKLHPHPLAFYDMYAIWLYVIVLTALFVLFGKELSSYVLSNFQIFNLLQETTKGLDSSFLSDLPVIGSVIATTDGIAKFLSKNALVGLWLLCLFFSSMVIAVLRISWRWVFILLGVGIASIAITQWLELAVVSTYYIAIILSLFGILSVEFYRRAHTFYITNYRIVTELNFGGYKKDELNYDKINNLVLDQSVIGKMFNFGTIIPITASGLGMGEDSAAVTLGMGGQISKGPMIGGAITGSKGMNVPRSRSSYMLFGITNPQSVYDLISRQMHEHLDTPYLRDIKEGINKLVEQKEKRESFRKKNRWDAE